MRDEQDVFLTRLFSEQDQVLPNVDFLKQLVGRMEREQRKQRAYSIVVVFAILVLGAIAAPWVAQMTSILVDLLAAATNAIEAVFASPIAWLAGGALAFAFLPVVYLWRTWQD